MKRIRLLLADDHDIVLEGLRRVLDQPDFEIVGAVKDGRALLRAVDELQPDIVISDITMPQLNGIDAARQIRKDHPKVKIIFLTMHPDVTFATEALQAGGAGYVLKSAAGDELVAAIREALRGSTFVTESVAKAVKQFSSPRSQAWRDRGDQLTSRQREVVQLLVEGHSVKEVAAKLHVSPRTVEFHKYRVLQELGLRTIAELSRYAVRHGIVA